VSEFGINGVRPVELRQVAQYVVGLGIIGALLYFAGMPLFLLLFVGVLTFFLWKVFAAEGRGKSREIFEFYLLSSEILRDDNRRWFGFEIQEAIKRGEDIVASMPIAPPLLHFTLGALYQKIRQPVHAERNLSMALQGPEISFAQRTRELGDYVRMLRRIESSPSEAPQTAAAVRSLERLRRTGGQALLDETRRQSDIGLSGDKEQLSAFEANDGGAENVARRELSSNKPKPQIRSITQTTRPRKVSRHAQTPESGVRPTISEVLHDVYDSKG